MSCAQYAITVTVTPDLAFPNSEVLRAKTQRRSQAVMFRCY
jgi:hypothetical protein